MGSSPGIPLQTQEEDSMKNTPARALAVLTVLALATVPAAALPLPWSDGPLTGLWNDLTDLGERLFGVDKTGHVTDPDGVPAPIAGEDGGGYVDPDGAPTAPGDAGSHFDPNG